MGEWNIKRQILSEQVLTLETSAYESVYRPQFTNVNKKKDSDQKEKQSVSTGCVNDLKVTWLTRGIQYVVLVTEKLIKRIHVNCVFTFTISDLFQFVVVNSWSDANCYHPHVLFLGNEWPCSLRFLGLATSNMNLEYIWGLCFSCFNGFVSLDRFWIFLHYDLYVIQKGPEISFSVVDLATHACRG